MRWALTDHLGTVRDLADDTGAIVDHRVYDAFGTVVHDTDAAIDELFGFTGRPFDEETGLQNNLHRWYDSSVGRCISEDPIGFAGRDVNLYRYVGNSPTTVTDPSGLLGPGQPKGDWHNLQGAEPPEPGGFFKRYTPAYTRCLPYSFNAEEYGTLSNAARRGGRRDDPDACPGLQ